MPKRYREYALAGALLGVCGLLLLILLSEWAYFRNRQADLKARLAEKVEVQLKTQALGQARYELPGLDDYAATVERPLFMEGRKPAEVDAGLAEVPNVIKAPLNLKLMGVLTAPDHAVGLFMDAKGKYKRLRKNESLAGWKLAELGPDAAVMEQDGTREELKVFKPKLKKKPEFPVPGQPPVGQPAVPPGGVPAIPPQQPMQPPVNPEFQPMPVEPDQPNPEAVDESAFPPEDPANAQ